MWIFVTMDFAQTRPGRQLRDGFCKELAKDGFSLLNRNTWVRYCTTLGNAQAHRERVKRLIPERSCVTLILVADKQCDYMYNHYGRHSRRKNVPEMPPTTDMIEFF